MLFSVTGARNVREQHFYTSKTYLSLPMMLFERKEEPNPKKTQEFGMLDYSVLNHSEVQGFFPHSNLRRFTTLDEMFEAYNKKEIDTIFLSRPESEYAIVKLGLEDNKISITPYQLPLKFYLSKAYPIQALTVLNAFIDKLNPADIEIAVLDEENAIRTTNSLGIFLEENKFLISFCILVLMLLLSTIYLFRVKREKLKLRNLFDYDHLTGLYSKKKAFEIIKKTLNHAKPGEYAAYTIDIDKFSFLNQVYGKDKASTLLCFFAKLLAERNYKHGAKCVSRIRDDVFLIFTKTEAIKNEPDREEYTLLLIHEAQEILQSNYSMSMSRGCYIIDNPDIPVETIIDYCNTARCKGKDKYGFSSIMFTKEMLNEINLEKEITHSMEYALENNEFELHFQPMLDLKSEKTCTAEVLVRWKHQNSKTIFPDEFIPIFEKNAFITKLDMYIFEEICKFIHENRNRYELPSIAINLSGLSILHDNTCNTIKELLEKYHVSSSEIEIEITESAFVIESEIFLQFIDELVELGFTVAIDDFGTGVSSLYRLSLLNVHHVKLDKAFLDYKLTSKKGILLVASLISMLHRLGMKIVAEGVENETHLAILKKIHCDIAQGYHFYKPLNKEDFLETLNVSKNLLNRQYKNEPNFNNELS